LPFLALPKIQEKVRVRLTTNTPNLRTYEIIKHKLHKPVLERCLEALPSEELLCSFCSASAPEPDEALFLFWGVFGSLVGRTGSGFPVESRAPGEEDDEEEEESEDTT
jgi:hypothetical protein